MKLDKDLHIKHDIIVKKGSNVTGDISAYEDYIEKSSGLVEVKLRRKYQVRGNLIIETGAMMEIGENRAAQLDSIGITKSEVNAKDVKERHLLKANRQNKKEEPIVITHKIENDGSK